MTALDRAIASQRRESLRIEREAQRSLTAAYRTILARLQADLDALTTRIAAAQAAGETVGASWLNTDARYRQLIADTEAELRRYSVDAATVIANGQRAAALAALQTSEAVMAAALGTPPPGVGVAFNRLPVGAIEQLVGNLGDGRPLSALLDGLGKEASKAGRLALIEGLGKGLGPRQIAREFRLATNESAVRALRISRQEINRAYRNSALANYRLNESVIAGWTWVAAGSAKTCAACFAKHGTFHKLDETFDSHVGCFTAGHTVSGPAVVGSTIRWYEGDIIEIVTLAGNLLSVTPNHPILTPNGWIAAGLLNEGDEVISARRGEYPLATVNPDEYQEPALIEEVARAYGSERGVIPLSVPTSAVDFHGDGEGSKVCIIRTDGLLGDAINTSLSQPFAQEQFGRRDVSLPLLPSQGRLAFLLKGVGLLCRTLSSRTIPFVFFGRSGRHHQAIGRKWIANSDTLADQMASNHATRHVEGFPKGFLGLTSEIATDNLLYRDSESLRSSGATLLLRESISLGSASTKPSFIQGLPKSDLAGVELGGGILSTHAIDIGRDSVFKVNRRSFRGHVYNLQTTGGWYISNNIITHNCRCTPVPRTKSWAELGFGDIPDTRPQIPDRDTLFGRLSADEQRQVLGMRAFDLWQAGSIGLEDMAVSTRSRVWGGGIRQARLSELEQIGAQPIAAE